jgi:hypothetical protein
MSIVTQAGRTLCLIVAVCCGATSANPYPPESRLSGDTQSINQTQSRPEANSTIMDLPRLLVLVKATEAQHYSPLFVLDHRGVGEFHTAGLRD